MVQFANRNRTKYLTVDEDDEKTLHQRIEVTETRSRNTEGNAYISETMHAKRGKAEK